MNMYNTRIRQFHAIYIIGVLMILYRTVSDELENMSIYHTCVHMGLLTRCGTVELSVICDNMDHMYIL
jgi:hypothetical protein